LAERRIRSAHFNLGAEGAVADLSLVLVGGRHLGTLSETGQARSAYHGLAGQRSARLDGERAMTGTRLAAQEPDYSDDTDLVIPEQPPIRVFTNHGGGVVINQHRWREDEDETYIFFRPEHAFALCRAILKEVGFEPDSVLREVTAKDPHAAERQRRHREKQRDCHGLLTVTVTDNEVDEPHQEMGSSPES
jgi:hypothetical protein